MTATIPGERGQLTALRGAWLFDGTGPALIPDPVVVIEGSIIRDVCSGGRVPETPGSGTVIDLPGATLQIKEILGPMSNSMLDDALKGEPPPEWTRRPRAKDGQHGGDPPRERGAARGALDAREPLIPPLRRGRYRGFTVAVLAYFVTPTCPHSGVG